MKFPFFFYPNGYVNRRKILQYSNRGFGGGRGKSEKWGRRRKWDTGSVNGSKNRKGRRSEREDGNKKEFWKKRGAAKIFPRKFCGLKNNPYVCSA